MNCKIFKAKILAAKGTGDTGDFRAQGNGEALKRNEIAEWLALCETGKLEYGQAMYNMLGEMGSEELNTFFGTVSQHELASAAFCKGLPTILEVFIDERNTSFSEAFDNIIEFFPECIGKSLHYILTRDFYSSACKVELYALQLVADSRYGCLTSVEPYIALREWVRNNVDKLISHADGAMCTSEMIWMLKNEFDVEESVIVDAMLEHTEAFINKCQNGELDYDDYEHMYFGDDLELSIITEYLMSREGYDLMEDNCYRLARMLPDSVVTISDMFPHADEVLLLKVAREPDNELISEIL